MMMDPIADMLTRIRNAHMAKKRDVEVPFSKMKHAIAEILQQEGYVQSVKTVDSKKMPALVIELKYRGNLPAIQSVTSESTPGHRKYRKALEMPRVLNGYGMAIVSTSQGIMTADEAKKRGIGGELLCSIY